MKVYSTNNNKVGIIRQNILTNNGDVTACYILKPNNYSIQNYAAKEEHISTLEKVLTVLSNQKDEMEVNIFKIKKIITSENIKDNLIDTVQLWDPSYGEVPDIFTVDDSVEELTFMTIKIDNKEIGDVDDLTFRQMSKEMLQSYADKLLSSSGISLNIENIVSAEEKIYNSIDGLVIRPSRETTFYSYASNVFPSYNISYSKNSYIENNLSPIAGLIAQEFSPRIGYFEMDNNGIELLGGEIDKTYGSVITVRYLPDEIHSEQFNLDYDGIRVSIKTLPKKKATTKIKRKRADLEYEQETAEDAGSRYAEDYDDSIGLAEQALALISQGTVMVEMKVCILALADSKKEIKAKRQNIISSLADSDIIAAPSIDQAKDYVNCFIKGSPTSYDHLCELRYALSFQIDDGVNVGENDSKYYSPTIGYANN